MKYLSLDRLVCGGPLRRRQSFLKTGVRVHRGFNLVMESIEGGGELPELKSLSQVLERQMDWMVCLRETGYVVCRKRAISLHCIEGFRL